MVSEVDVRILLPARHPRAAHATRLVRALVERIAGELDSAVPKVVVGTESDEEHVLVRAYATSDRLERARPRLTPRQRDILRLVDRGLLTKQIALELGISQHTVNRHLQGLFRLLGVSSRTEALHVARRLRLL